MGMANQRPLFTVAGRGPASGSQNQNITCHCGDEKIS